MRITSAIALAVLALFTAGCDVRPPTTPASELAGLETRGERSGWIETSSHAEVMDFLRAADEGSASAHLETMGYTTEGRPIPLLVIGDVEDGSPEAVRASGKLRVYLQGDIHGGEVPGKEALQMLVRDLLTGQTTDWTDELVLLVNPIYNADGNERVALGNRPRQHGPIGGMGQRPNAQGYDLNRDHMKLDSPEARSFAAMLTAYDPEVGVDLHTTNGTRHAYHLTYSPPLHPGAPDEVVDLLRDVAFPEITTRIREQDGWEYYYYGNASPRNGEPAWVTFDHRPRFNNNYVGLRNRVAILSEAYAYLTYEDRVRATYRFVEEILDWARDDADDIRDAVAAADGSIVGEILPTRAVPEPSDTLVTILMGDVVEERHPYTGATILRRIDVVEPTPMREYGTFMASDTEVAPARYFVPPEASVIIDRLLAHGVETRELEAPTTVEGEVFRMSAVDVATREFQGHNEHTVSGEWVPETLRLPAGTLEVDVSRPLGRLTFYLLEPRSDDGLAAWGLISGLEAGGDFPVTRVR
ncbi:MAG TPA: M14 family metallopeptidase [Longimicrobiales bacterium]|nr:M14 family metallopeptidase [Longimicrobiales bacterium]